MATLRENVTGKYTRDQLGELAQSVAWDPIDTSDEVERKRIVSDRTQQEEDLRALVSRAQRSVTSVPHAVAVTISGGEIDQIVVEIPPSKTALAYEQELRRMAHGNQSAWSVAVAAARAAMDVAKLTPELADASPPQALIVAMAHAKLMRGRFEGVLAAGADMPSVDQAIGEIAAEVARLDAQGVTELS